MLHHQQQAKIDRNYVYLAQTMSQPMEYHTNLCKDITLETISLYTSTQIGTHGKEIDSYETIETHIHEIESIVCYCMNISPNVETWSQAKKAVYQSIREFYGNYDYVPSPNRKYRFKEGLCIGQTTNLDYAKNGNN